MYYTNHKDISLLMAVWAAKETYVPSTEANSISATTIIRPIKPLILTPRVPITEETIPDISNNISSRMGNGIHDSIEKAWKESYKESMRMLGYPEKTIEKIIINPTDEQLSENIIPVYIEERFHRRFGKYTISGKVDFIIDGRLHDVKTTSVMSYTKGRKDKAYSLQGSIYRWLRPDLIYDDHIYIQFLFTDWNGMLSKSQKDYPKQRFIEHKVPLLSIDETTHYIRSKLLNLEKYKDAPQHEIPECADEDLWRSEPVFKFYANPAKTAKATRNFTSMAEAQAYKSSSGAVNGIIKTIKSEPKACLYCPAYTICEQRKAMNV